MQDVQDISEIFSLWPSTQHMAAELGELEDTVYRWTKRRRIPEHALTNVIRFGQPRTEALLTIELLMRLNTPKRRNGRPRKPLAVA